MNKQFKPQQKVQWKNDSELLFLDKRVLSVSSLVWIIKSIDGDMATITTDYMDMNNPMYTYSRVCYIGDLELIESDDE